MGGRTAGISSTTARTTTNVSFGAAELVRGR